MIGFSQCTGGDVWRKTMHEEMRREASFYPDVELQIKDAENSSDTQIRHIREFISQGVDLLIVSPNESKPITPIVEEAFEQGIPVIIVDRRTASSLYTAYVGANNYEIGQLAGNYAATLLGGKGKVVEVWGLKGSSPAIDRHRGFTDALSGNPEIEIIAEVNGEWEKEVAKAKFPAYASAAKNADLVFAHNDVMALGVYEYLSKAAAEESLAFIGVDGLGGPNGGLQFVEDGILDATVLYPTGGEETIRLANKILRNEPYEKENILPSTLIDGRNIHIMKQQTNKIRHQQSDIERQQEKINEQIRIYRNQRTLLYILLGSLSLIIVLGALVLRALREKHEINKTLEAKNKEVVSQRNEIARMARKADKATRAKFKFFTNISHEFRTPLTLILGPVEDALGSDLSPELKKDMQLVRANAVRLLNLVNQLMDFRKIENQKMKLQASERDLVQFVKQLSTSFERLAKKRGIDFQVKTAQERLPVYFDADKLDKVLFNLLSNAFKFTQDGERVRIKIGLTDGFDSVYIIVEDTGRGMSEEHVKHAFDRFFTGEAYSNLSTGLGLALSREFVQLHRGEIKVLSEKWKGTKFILTLPLGKSHLEEDEIVTATNTTDAKGFAIYSPLNVADDLQDLPAAPSELPTIPVTKEHTLLLIEDNAELREYLRRNLQKEFHVIEAPDGILGLSQAFEAVPDLIVCDVMLPNKSGLEVSKSLKSDLRTSHIPLILLTARDSVEQKIEGVQSGADLYVTKPFSYQYLLERIRGLIKTRSLLKEHYSAEIPVDIKASAPKQLDKKFINDFMAVVEKNLSNTSLSANDIASELGMSRVQVYRKVKALLGYSVNDYVINVRLKKAKHLLLNSDKNISEVAYEVGFSSPAYFSTTFKNHCNMSPTDFKSAAVSKY